MKSFAPLFGLVAVSCLLLQSNKSLKNFGTNEDTSKDQTAQIHALQRQVELLENQVRTLLNDSDGKGAQAVVGDDVVTETTLQTTNSSSSLRGAAAIVSSATDPATMRQLLQVSQDKFDPALTLEDYPKLPPSIPNEAWLTDCVTAIEKDTSIMKPFYAARPWYEMGDCIRFCIKCGLPGDRFKAAKHLYEDTIALRYGEQACRPSNNTDVYNTTKLGLILDDFGSRKSTFETPDPDAIVLHLRLGDMIQYDSKTPAAMLIEGTRGYGRQGKDGVMSVRSFYEYLEIIGHDKTNTKVQIIGGSQKLKKFQKSKPYAHCLARGLAKAGKQVTANVEGGDADKDFYFLSHSKKIIPSCGGYSMLISDMAEIRGGEKRGRQFNLKEGKTWIPNALSEEILANAKAKAT